MLDIHERPPIPNRGEEIVMKAQNMLSLFDVLSKLNDAHDAILKNPTEENRKRFSHLDELVRNLMHIIPELDIPND